MMPDFIDMDDSWGKWVDFLDGGQSSEVQRLHRRILDGSLKHVLIPTILGSRHSGLVQKVHSLLHAAKMDAQTWKMVKRMMAKFSGFVSDQGTEHLFATVETNFKDLRISGALPHLADPTQEGSHGDEAPMMTTPPSTMTAPPAKIRKVDESMTDLELEFALAQVITDPESMVIDLDEEIPDTFCGHPGCELPVHTCCVHCLMPLCHLHCGALDRDHLELNQAQSRCHEHLNVPEGHHGIVQSPRGYVRCPCQRCMTARDGLLCPCPQCHFLCFQSKIK